MTLPRATVLAIGTELTTGQIVNRNAAWLSEKLYDLGISTVLHETVADDRAAIRDALERCRASGALLFVTGGLGPTSDDFTREVVAEWAEFKLEYHEPSWLKIVDRLTKRGVRVADSNKQQCFYPKGSSVLVNEEGTADGFTFKKGETRVWVLPGPPRELAAIWDSSIETELRSSLPVSKSAKPLTWDCLGISEAELGERVESALKGSGLLTGYRVHLPLIEVKVWATDHASPAIAKLESEIAPWTVARNGEDLGQLFLDALRARGSEEQVLVVDGGTQGVVLERLWALLRKPENQDIASRFSSHSVAALGAAAESFVIHSTERAAQDGAGDLVFSLGGFMPEGKFVLGLAGNGNAHTEILDCPYKSSLLADRMVRYAAEMAFKRWKEWLGAPPRSANA